MIYVMMQDDCDGCHSILRASTNKAKIDRMVDAANERAQKVHAIREQIGEVITPIMADAYAKCHKLFRIGIELDESQLRAVNAENRAILYAAREECSQIKFKMAVDLGFFDLLEKGEFSPDSIPTQELTNAMMTLMTDLAQGGYYTEEVEEV